MTQFILKRFVPDYDQKENPAVRQKVGSLSGIVGILCNVALFAAKLVIGTLSGSVSITADALNNLSDASGSIVTVLGFKLAERPADEDHPYGHARFEYLSGLAVAALILLIGVELAKSSIQKIIAPTAVAFSPALVLVLVLSILVKLWLSGFNTKLGKHIGSGALLATAADSRNDVISTAAVLVAALVEKFSGWHVDGYMGLAVAVFILYSGINMGKETISPLLGEGVSPELKEQVVKLVQETPKVLGYHDLMVHDYGPGQRFASLHVEMDKDEDPMACHDIIDDLERRCLETLGVHLVVHYDPVVTGDEALSYMRSVVETLLRQQDERLSIHDFRMVQGDGHTNLIFDIALPFDLNKQKRQIEVRLAADLKQHHSETTYYTVITFDSSAFNT